MTLDEEYMTQALERARRAAELGEIPVGAIVVDPDGNIIGDTGDIAEYKPVHSEQTPNELTAEKEAGE